MTVDDPGKGCCIIVIPNFTEFSPTKIPKLLKIYKKLPGESWKYRRVTPYKHGNTERKYILLILKITGNSRKTPGKISGKLPKFRKFAKIFPEKFPENSRKTYVFFTVKRNAAAQKSIVLFL